MLPTELAQAIADDACTLALLHDREMDGAALAVLEEIGFPGNLGLLPETTAQQEAWQLAEMAVQCLPKDPTPFDLDELAADYAAIYLTGAYGASPCESVWLDEDRLCFQGSMFEVRKLYQAHGLAHGNGRQRPDDHLALQLQFIGHLASRAGSPEDWRTLAAILDEHLLRWLPDFAHVVAGRCATAYYAGLAAVTAAWCERLRDCLATALKEPRPELSALAQERQGPPMSHQPYCASQP